MAGSRIISPQPASPFDFGLLDSLGWQLDLLVDQSHHTSGFNGGVEIGAAFMNHPLPIWSFVKNVPRDGGAAPLPSAERFHFLEILSQQSLRKSLDFTRNTGPNVPAIWFPFLATYRILYMFDTRTTLIQPRAASVLAAGARRR